MPLPSAVLLLSALAACSTTPPSPPPENAEPELPAPGPPPPEVCVLPAERPADLVIRFRQTIIPHGADISRVGLALRASCPPEEPLPCRATSPEALDALYRAFVERGFASLGQEVGGRASPHYGARSLELSWSDQGCTVADDHQRPLRDPDQATFSELTSLVRGAGLP